MPRLPDDALSYRRRKCDKALRTLEFDTDKNGFPLYMGALMSLTQAQVRQVMRRVLREPPA